MRGLCIRIWFVFGPVGFLPHYNNTLAQLYRCGALCLVDGMQFIAEWKEHLPSYANDIIIYSRVLAILVLLLLHPISTHLSSSMAWGIIFAQGFLFSNTHARTHTRSHSHFCKAKKKNQICSRKGWIIDVMLKKGWNNHSPLDVGGTSNPELEVGRLGRAGWAQMYLGRLPCEISMNSAELED